MKSYKGLMENIPYPGTSVQMPQVLFKRPRTSGRRTSCGKTFNLKNGDNVERVKSDRRLTRMISSELNLNRFNVHQILTQDLDMRKVCAKMVPKNLTTEQKASPRDVFLDLLDHLEREPEFFSHIITGNESWILEYDSEKKHQSREWHTCKLSPSQESENEQIQNQIDAFFF